MTNAQPEAAAEPPRDDDVEGAASPEHEQALGPAEGETADAPASDESAGTAAAEDEAKEDSGAQDDGDTSGSVEDAQAASTELASSGDAAESQDAAQLVDPPLAPLESGDANTVGRTSAELAGDDGEGAHPEPRDVTPAQALPSTILSPSLPPVAPVDLSASLSPAEAVAALQAQLRAVEEQRDQLNTKLVRSLERCADLEDEVFHAQDASRQSAKVVETLQEERKEHLHALDTGLLIEEANVKNEMQRLASSLAEAQGKRELAEEGKRTVENEVDDLAASLFQQANSMVATERLARSRAETRLKEAEDNLSVAESVVREMQQAMQDLHHASKTRGLTASASLTSLVGHASSVPRPLRTSHLPYSEFLLFVQHVRALRPLTAASTTTPAQIPPPVLTSLLSQPLLARLLAEDHDPALRLDFAPGVGWISKKGITHAIVEGMLTVEPVSSATVFAQKPDADIVCALSGKLIAAAPTIPAPASGFAYGAEGMLALAGGNLPLSTVAPPPAHPSRSTASRFFSRSGSSRPVSPTSAVNSGQPTSPPAATASNPPPSTIFIFRIAPPSNVPLSEQKAGTLYPVESGWSLDRLRATCELWRFVKTGILQPIWAYEDGTERPPAPPPPTPAQLTELTDAAGAGGLAAGAVGRKPELPPRKKSWGLSGWGLGRSADKTLPTTTTAATAGAPPAVPPRRLPPPIVEAAKDDKAPKPVVAPVAEPETLPAAQEASDVEAVASKEDFVDPTLEPASDAPAVVAPVVEISPSESDRAASPAPVDGASEDAAADDDDSAEPAEDVVPAPVPAADELATDAPASLTVEQTSPTPDSGAESDAFETPTEETAAHPIEKELADKAAVEEGAAPEGAVDEPATEDVQAETVEGLTDAAPTDETPAVVEASEEQAIPSSPATPATPTLAPPSTDDAARTSIDSQRSAGAPPPLPRRAPARRPVPPPPGATAAAAVEAKADDTADAVKPDLPPRTSLEQPAAAPGPPPPPPRRVPGAAAAAPVVDADATVVELAAVEADQEAALAQQKADADERARKQAAQEAKAREWEEAAWRVLAAVRERLFWMRVGEEPLS